MGVPFQRSDIQSQLGQVLVMSTIVLGLICVAILYYFWMARSIQQKSHLQATADSAAYSAALLQARSLNFHAYINRTQVAHQIAMGHAVTLASWASFVDQQAQQSGRRNPPAGVIASFFPFTGRGYLASSIASGAHARYSLAATGQLARAFMEIDRTVHHVLSTSQQVVQQRIVTNRDHLVQEILRASQPAQASSQELPRVEWLEDTWAGNTVLETGKVASAIGQATQKVQRHYTFLQARNHTENSLLPLEKRCPWMRHQLRRQGLTVFGPDGRWASADTLSWHSVRSNKTIGCYYREYPMGYHTTQTGAHSLDRVLEHAPDVPPNFSETDFWKWAQNNTTWNILGGTNNPLANSLALKKPTKWGGHGVPNSVQLNTKKAPNMFLTLLLFQHATAQKPAQASLRSLEPFQQRLPITRAVSRAQTYYVDPEQRSEQRPNLFMAYWQARLVGIPDAILSKVDAKRDSGGTDGL